MPRFIGRSIPGARPLPDKYDFPICSLTYAQAIKLPPDKVYYTINDTDRGSRGVMAKRWYNWFAPACDVLEHPDATENMRTRAGNAAREFFEKAKPLEQ